MNPYLDTVYFELEQAEEQRHKDYEMAQDAEALAAVVAEQLSFREEKLMLFTSEEMMERAFENQLA